MQPAIKKKYLDVTGYCSLRSQQHSDNTLRIIYKKKLTSFLECTIINLYVKRTDLQSERDL